MLEINSSIFIAFEWLMSSEIVYRLLDEIYIKCPDIVFPLIFGCGSRAPRYIETSGRKTHR